MYNTYGILIYIYCIALNTIIILWLSNQLQYPFNNWRNIDEWMWLLIIWTGIVFGRYANQIRTLVQVPINESSTRIAVCRSSPLGSRANQFILFGTAIIASWTVVLGCNGHIRRFNSSLNIWSFEVIGK